MAPPSINSFTTDMAYTNGHSLQGASSDDGHLAHFWNLYEDSKQHDHTKNVLIEVSEVLGLIFIVITNCSRGMHC